jgi:hypothetical protein
MDHGEADSVLSADGDALIADYLTRLRRAAWYLPRDRREQVLNQIAEHFAAVIESTRPGRPEGEPPPTQQQPPSEPPPTQPLPGSTQPVSPPRNTAQILADLGEPKALIRAVDGHVPGTEAGWLEYTAIIAVLLLGLLTPIGWAIAVVLLWASPRWRWPDKLLATLVWPGGLLVARLLMEHYVITAFPFPGVRSSVRFVLDATLGHHPLRHFFVLAAAIAPPALVAIRLLRRARRARQPTAPPWLATGGAPS